MANIKKEHTRKGDVRFVVDFYHAGRRYRKYFATYEDADAYLAATKVKIYGGQFHARPKPVSLAQLTREYLTDSRQINRPATHRDTNQFRVGNFLFFLYTRRTGRNLESDVIPTMDLFERGDPIAIRQDPTLGPFIDFLEGTRLERVLPADMKEYRSALLNKGHLASTVNSYVTTVHHFLETAIAAKYLRENPAKMKKLREDRKLINPYTKEEIVSILRAARADDERRNMRFRRTGRTFHLFPLVATALFGGLRENELAYLDHPDLDLERDLIWVRVKPGFKPKSHQERAIPLEPLLRQILEPLKKPSGPCFPNGSGGRYLNDMLSDVKLIGEAAGVQEITVHLLRHNYASHQIMNGVSHFLVMNWMGHKDSETLRRYVHLSPGTNRFKNPSIFGEKDIFALLDAPPAQPAAVIPLPVAEDREQARKGS